MKNLEIKQINPRDKPIRIRSNRDKSTNNSETDQAITHQLKVNHHKMMVRE